MPTKKATAKKKGASSKKSAASKSKSSKSGSLKGASSKGVAAAFGDVAPLLGAKQAFFGTAARTDSTTSTSFVNLVPTPGQVFSTTGNSTFLVQFFGSARLSAAGQAMDLRATVDGNVVNPGPMRYSGTGFSSVCYSGFLSNIGPGTHTVTLQWMVTGGTGFLSNRTFIVWVFPQ
ncbi:MAG TPA: hypothetical protein VJ842_03245 [Pyrinomonadaceae bacterium]|nr:hypothetical protein [Pyrinomonadaceae bacterium]